MRRVYVAGPYTKGDPCQNTHAAMLAGAALLDAGFAPFVPHLSHFWHTAAPRPYADWIALDLAWVAVAECVLRLPGESSGADKEVALARSLGIPVYESVEAVVRAEGGRSSAAADCLEALRDGGLDSAIDQMGEVEDRCVRARLSGKAARISITASEWSTLRDTLVAYRDTARAAIAKAEGGAK